MLCPAYAQQRIHRVPLNAFEEVSGQSAIRLELSDHRFDSVTPFELPLDCLAHATFGYAEWARAQRWHR
jgi:hypothetical protein